MTDPTPETTPTRDEAVLDESKVTTAMIDAAFKVCPAGAIPEIGTGGMQRMIAAALASAPAPASGGVDAVERLEDKIEGLEADLASAVEVAFRRGAAEWTRLNYPALYVRLNAASLSPTATPVSEAGGELVGKIVWFEGVGNEVSWSKGRMPPAGTKLYALGKPASSPAGGDVREALKAGWNACRKSVYAVCEDVISENERHREDTENPPRHHFGRGGMTAAKSIARGFNSMEAEDDDNFTAALAALSSPATPEPALAGGVREAVELACESIDWIAVQQTPDVRADLERLTSTILAAIDTGQKEGRS